jgi:glycosyltransferase involved in cell wall biosynthesis
MPAYNGEKYIRRALDSLIAQDYENVELIISDNASTDATLQICEEYASRENRISIHKNPHNLGIEKNLKTVLELAQGEYFMWAAVDDYWLPEFVSDLLRVLNDDAESGVAMCGVDLVLADGSYYDTIRFAGRNEPNSKSPIGLALRLASPLKYNYFMYGLFRTNLLRSAVSLLTIIPSGDRWFLLQIALAARFRYVDRVLHIRTVHKQPYYERYPGEEFGRKKLVSDQKWFDFEPIPVVWRILSKSTVIPGHRKLLIPIILSYLSFTRMILGMRKMIRSLIVKWCSENIQDRLLRSRER